MSDLAPMASWSSEPLARDVRRALERIRASDDVVRVAVMPDVHLAEEVCVGTVVATTRTLYPDAVGGDIGCGMGAVQLDITREHVDDPAIAARILANLDERVPILAHRAESAPVMPPSLSSLSHGAERQLGTLGRGNHFIELQVDDAGDVWLAIHSGSRGLGPAIRDRALSRARKSKTGLAFLDAESDDGIEYLASLAGARAYADANRSALFAAAAAAVHDATGAAVVEGTAIRCEHNHVVKVDAEGGALWVHRKGATPASSGTAAIIPGSMGAPTYHVEGRSSADALWSSSHGAGRAMSRTEARKRISVERLTRDVHGVWFDRRKASALVDESPAAYKDIATVMRAQRDLVRIVRVVRPLLSFKGV